jgi:NADH:ubiquinone oxidoreductase subunit 2 (subunit N)
MVMASVLITLAMLLKLGVAPMHNWAPDLYGSLPLPVAFWFAIVPKLAIFTLLLQLPILRYASLNLTFSALSFLVGAIGLTGQWQVGRFLAYSAIVHFGYLCLSGVSSSWPF